MQQEKPSSSELKLQHVAMMSMQVGFVVAITALVFVFLGKWIDTKFHTQPLGFLASMGLGFTVSILLVWQIVKPLWQKLSK